MSDQQAAGSDHWSDTTPGSFCLCSAQSLYHASAASANSAASTATQFHTSYLPTYNTLHTSINTLQLQHLFKCYIK